MVEVESNRTLSRSPNRRARLLRLPRNKMSAILRIFALVVVAALAGTMVWYGSASGASSSGPSIHSGNPHKAADTMVQGVKADAKNNVNNLSASSAVDANTDTPDKMSKLDKLKATETDLTEMLKIMHSWSKTAPMIPSQDWWPDAYKKRLNVTGQNDPKWREILISDLDKKLSKIKRRITLPKTRSK